jgi:hypothetical protein
VTTTINLPIETVTAASERGTCPESAAKPPGEDGCQHPSGSCKPEGCSAC